MLHDDPWDVIPGIFLWLWFVTVTNFATLCIVLLNQTHHYHAVGIAIALLVMNAAWQAGWFVWRVDWPEVMG